MHYHQMAQAADFIERTPAGSFVPIDKFNAESGGMVNFFVLSDYMLARNYVHNFWTSRKDGRLAGLWVILGDSLMDFRDVDPTTLTGGHSTPETMEVAVRNSNPQLAAMLSRMNGAAQKGKS